METISKHYMSWTEFEYLIEKLIYQIQSSDYKYNLIYGCPRGGLIPAVVLSHRLGISLTQDYINVGHLNVLIIDDICDTGKTISEYVGYHSATLHYKLTAIIKPTYYSEITDKWVVYPWENIDSETIQDYKK
jgi:hypoxanthine phosphoribosyltransferase